MRYGKRLLHRHFDYDFIDDRLIGFIRKELELPEIADKIERFYGSVSDQDATLQMLLSEVGYYTEAELQEFQQRLVQKRRRNGPERVRGKADSLYQKKRYESAIRAYRTLVQGRSDGRITPQFYAGVLESMANAYGHLSAFDRAFECLSRIYDDNRSERILKKMYDVAVLSGMELPDRYFAKVPDSKLNAWQQDYWNRETVLKGQLPENGTMQMFLHDPETLKSELKQYVDDKKEEYRGMLE